MQQIDSWQTRVSSNLLVNHLPIKRGICLTLDLSVGAGLFVAIGSAPALAATPGMLAYGLSKAGTHHVIQTLGETTGKALTTRSKRQKARRLRRDSQYLDSLSVIGLLPTTIDTPNNRVAMPEANFADWTKPVDIANELGFWIETPQLRPHSGSLVKVHPAKGGGAVFTIVR
jgi:dihydropteridine reductase